MEAPGHEKKIAVEQTSAPLVNESTKFDIGWAHITYGLIQRLNGVLPGYYTLVLPPRINFGKSDKSRLVEALISEIIDKSSELGDIGEILKFRLGLDAQPPISLELKKVRDKPSGIAIFPNKFAWLPAVEPKFLADILRKSFHHANSKFEHPDLDFGDWEAYERLLFIDHLPIQILSEDMDQCKEAVNLLVHEGEAERIDSVYVMRWHQSHRMY